MYDSILMEQIRSKMGKGSYPSINQNDIKKFYLLLPPIETQKKIIKIFYSLDKQIADQETLVKKCDEDIQAKFVEMFGSFAKRKNHTFIELCDDDTKNGVKFDRTEYLETGEIPVIDQGVNLIAGWRPMDADKLPYSNLPCVLFGDHTEIFKYVSEEFYLGADGVKILVPRNRNILNTYFLFYMLRKEYRPTGKYERHFKALKALPLYLPPIDLQNQFAAFVNQCEKTKADAQKRREALLLQREQAIEEYFR